MLVTEKHSSRGACRVCTAVVDYVGLESDPGLADFADEVTCIDSDMVLGLTSKPNAGDLPLLTASIAQ